MPRQAQSAPQQAYTLPPEKLAKAIALSRIRITLGIAGAVWGIVFLWLLLAARAWVAIERWTQRISGRRWVQGLEFFAAFFLVTALAGLPLDATAHHFERAYGISVQAWGSWLGDQAKALGLTLLVGAPILLLFHWIVRRWPRRYWLAAWVVTLPILAFSIFLEPLFEPIFFHFEPLQKNHAALVSELEKVAARTGTNIPPSRMVLMKASVKTNGLNAYVSGLGATKRIVVWDTTAGRIPDDEVLFIFGHESGHYVLHHIAKGFVGSAVGLLFVYWACAAFAAWLVKRFGARWIDPKPEDLIHAEPALASRTGFVVLLFAISIAGFLTEPVVNAVSRHFEHQADVYGQEAIHGIVADPAEDRRRRVQRSGSGVARGSPSQPVPRLLALRPPQHPTARRVRRALRSVGDRRAWGVLQKIGFRGQGPGRQSQPLKDARGSHAATNAHRHHPVPCGTPCPHLLE